MPPRSSAAIVGGLLVAALGGSVAAQQPEHKEIRWVRASKEYVLLTRQIYAQATRAVQAAASRQRGPWAVVLDVDETVLDNSAYQLEIAAYRMPFDTASWNAWVRRAEAGAVPGAAEFVAVVREAGGRIAFISGREESTREATRRNLAALGLARDGDLICLRDPAGSRTKRIQRTELRTGRGGCSWNTAVPVVAYLGDATGDFPDPDEEPGEFGVKFFMLANPMYGSWERGVTR